MVRYAVPILALLLVASAGAAAAAARGMHGDMGYRGAGRGAMAPGVECNKQCVKELQRQLHTRGMYMGKMDGIPGPQTRQAVMDFQSQQGVKATGMIDDQVLSALGVSSGRGGAQMQPSQPHMGGGM